MHRAPSVTTSGWVVVGLVAAAGFLAGGAYSLWRTARMLAVLLAAAAVLAAAAAVVWLL
jgi:hypothetical protein